MITTNDFPALTDDMQSIFNEVARTSVADMVGNKVFHVFDTNRKTYDHLILHGMSGIKQVTPGQDLPNVTSEEGDSVTWTQKYYGAIVAVTKEMRKFDLHNEITSLVKSITTDAFEKIDQSLADVLLYGWDTSYTDVYGKVTSAVGPDGLELFSRLHSNNINSDTFDNEVAGNPALSREAILSAINQGLTHKDPSGVIRPIHYTTLIVPPALYDLAVRLCNSELLPGTGNNDINALKGRVTNIVLWERLESRSDDTDTSAYWFMTDGKKIGETLNCLFAERPSLDAPEKVYSNKNWEYSCDYFYTIGIGYPAYIIGSNGSGTA